MKKYQTFFASASMAVLIAFSFAGCSEDESTQCSRDQECPRGYICEAQSSVCVAERCNSLGDCPGSGRTCLSDTNTCSRKECGDAEGACPEGQVCFESGPYRWSCGSLEVDAGAGSDGGPDMLGAGGTGGAGGAAGSGGSGGSAGAGGEGGAGGMEYEGLCQECMADRDCAGIAEGSECTPFGNTGSFCTAPCQDGGVACPEGFSCLEQLGQCVPVNYDCTTCPGRPCQAGSVCDASSGQCVEPRTACQPCSGDASCADNHACGEVSNGSFCLLGCEAAGDCPADYDCQNGACTPLSGRCDACAGRCEAPNAACISETGQCGECSNDVPCPLGSRCDAETNTCSEGDSCECTNDAQCGACNGRPICLQGSCVACLDDTDCPARSTCNPETFSCDSSPCAGVSCQRESACDVMSGRCSPGCNNSNDCADPMTMECNPGTGQCYYLDGTCDAGEQGDGVCAPGSACTVNPLFMTTACTCKKANPDDFLSMELLIPCQPGQICLHLPGTPEGNCLALGN